MTERHKQPDNPTHVLETSQTDQPMFFNHPPDRMMHALKQLGLSLCISSVVLMLAYGAKPPANKKQIKNLQSRITQLQQTLNQNQTRRRQATTRLAQTETNLGNLKPTTQSY